MRHAVVYLSLTVVLVGRGIGSSAFSEDQVRTTFRAHGLPLKTEGYFRFGPERHVLYLDWQGRGGIHTTKTRVIVTPVWSFVVLVFRSAAQAKAALANASVMRYLRANRTPAARRGNVVLTLKNATPDAADWRRWTHVLSTIGR